MEELETRIIKLLRNDAGADSKIYDEIRPNKARVVSLLQDNPTLAYEAGRLLYVELHPFPKKLVDTVCTDETASFNAAVRWVDDLFSKFGKNLVNGFAYSGTYCYLFYCEGEDRIKGKIHLLVQGISRDPKISLMALKRREHPDLEDAELSLIFDRATLGVSKSPVHAYEALRVAPKEVLDRSDNKLKTNRERLTEVVLDNQDLIKFYMTLEGKEAEKFCDFSGKCYQKGLGTYNIVTDAFARYQTVDRVNVDRFKLSFDTKALDFAFNEIDKCDSNFWLETYEKLNYDPKMFLLGKEEIRRIHKAYSNTVEIKAVDAFASSLQISIPGRRPGTATTKDDETLNKEYHAMRDNFYSGLREAIETGRIKTWASEFELKYNQGETGINPSFAIKNSIG